MDTRQHLTFESLTDCLATLKRREFARPEIEPLQAKLAEAVGEVRKLYQTQVTNHMGRTGDSGETTRLRKELRKRMMRIASNAVVSLEGLPGVEDDMRVPHANTKTSDLLDAANRFAKNVRPHLRTLHANGLPANALAQLETTARALEAKASSADTAIARRSRATSSLPDAIRRARKIVKALDVTIKEELADNTAALRMWTSATRIPRKKGRPKKPKPRD